MSASLFTTINSRIQQWASALIVACAAHPEATLRDLITGPLPAWWTFYQTNGFDVRMGAPAQGQRTLTHEFILRELDNIESAYSIKSALIVISDIVDQFIANDHNEAKLEFTQAYDPYSWVAPRNAAIPCFLEVRRALTRFMARLRLSLISSEDGKAHDDPIDSSFFSAD